MSAPSMAAALVDVLEEMATACERLLDAAACLRERLTGGTPESILAAVAEQERLMAALDAPEGRRRELVAALAHDLGLAPTTGVDALAGRLAASGAAPLAGRLLAAAGRLRASLRELASINEQNRALARQGLSTLPAVLQALAGEQPDPAGSRPAAPPPLRVDRRV